MIMTKKAGVEQTYQINTGYISIMWHTTISNTAQNIFSSIYISNKI